MTVDSHDYSNEQKRDHQFIKELDNSDILWRFHLMNTESFFGSLVDHILTAEGIPITIKIKIARGYDGFFEIEIPWSSIAFIEEAL